MCGVPQSSILGPIPFNFNVTDMSTFTSSTCLQFADDTNLNKRCKAKLKIYLIVLKLFKMK